MLDAVLSMLSHQNVILYIIAYLIGGVPFGLILAKMFASVNIKNSGSKSIGATNVLRVVKQTNPKLAKKLAIATVILDALKALIIIAIVFFMDKNESIQWSVGVFAVLGHCFSPYLNFEGGKGVATAVGVMIWFLPLEVFIALIAWAVLAKSVKISSISSLGALVVFVISSYIIHPELPTIISHAPVNIIVIIIIYKHIPNILRLFSGNEKQVV